MAKEGGALRQDGLFGYVLEAGYERLIHSAHALTWLSVCGQETEKQQEGHEKAGLSNEAVGVVGG